MLKWAFMMLICFSVVSCQKRSQVETANLQGVLICGNGSEPKSLDPQVVSGVTEANILRALFEGLVTYDPHHDDAAPLGAAESLIADETSTIWTVKLKRNAKWSDGTTVTAHDFVFAYERILSPEFAAKYAEMLYFLKNGEEFNRGTIKDFSQVGVTLIDDFTLQFTLRGPTPFFREILKHMTWLPVPRHIVLKCGGMKQIGNPWAKAENIVSNGPYKLQSWRRNDHILVQRNQHYWNNEATTLEAVKFLPITNPYTEARMFRDNQIHVTSGATKEMVDFMNQHSPHEVRQETYLGTLFYRFNTTRPPLNNPKVRLALSLSIDRQMLCSQLLPGNVPAYSITPPMGSYMPSPSMHHMNIQKAKALLKEAGFGEGSKPFPRMKILIPNSESSIVLAQAIQAMWRKHLQVEIDIEMKEWTAYLSAQQELNYDIASARWFGDYLDPLTFLEMWVANGGNNNTGWNNPQYGETLKTSFQLNIPEHRRHTLQQAEAMMMAEAPIAPITWASRNYFIKPEVKGWNALLLGNQPFQSIQLFSRSNQDAQKPQK